MLTIGLIIAFTLVTLAALVAVGLATGIWFGVKAARPEFLERGGASAPDPEATGPGGS
ncbi:MAG: hypothetical protein RIB67_10865 [Miltoncostaeaceae bacterium]